MLTPVRVFFASVFGAAALVVAYGANSPSPRRAAFNQVEGGVPIAGVPLGGGVTVRDQLAIRELEAIAKAGVHTVIAMRPDSEETGQPTSQALAAAAAPLGIKVIYLPTPLSHIPDDVADQLARHLSTAAPGVLLYCGSGWRAARGWALAEASRPEGRGVASIMAAVRNARHDIDDLKPRIEARFNSRHGVR